MGNYACDATQGNGKMTEFEIEKNVPVPRGAGNRGRRLNYPFDEMEVGDSFFAEQRPAPCGSTYPAATAANKYGKRHGKRFASRSVEGGVRIWRIE